MSTDTKTVNPNIFSLFPKDITDDESLNKQEVRIDAGDLANLLDMANKYVSLREILEQDGSSAEAIDRTNQIKTFNNQQLSYLHMELAKAVKAPYRHPLGFKVNIVGYEAEIYRCIESELRGIPNAAMYVFSTNSRQKTTLYYGDKITILHKPMLPTPMQVANLNLSPSEEVVIIDVNPGTKYSYTAIALKRELRIAACRPL